MRARRRGPTSQIRNEYHDDSDVALAETADPWSAEFMRAVASTPHLAGFASVDVRTPLSARVNFEGRLPPNLRGTLYRNGPALHEFGGLRYHHWFDGDGMVQAFRFGDDGLTHSGRLVVTEKLASEIKAGRRLRAAFGTSVPDRERPASNDSLNVANTNVLPLGEELLALWEGGSAISIDPDTLATKGPKVWRADLKGAPFSAHPKVDHGTVWNFGFDAFISAMLLYEIGRDGVLKRVEVLRIPGMTRVHDFVVTDRHLVFLLPPMRFSRSRFNAGETAVDCHEWMADAPLRVLVVEKNDLKTHRIFELPNGFAFHLGSAWEDQAGVIRFDYVRAADASVMTRAFKDVMRGSSATIELGRSSHVVLDTRSGRIAQTLVPGGVEYPRVDPRRIGERHRQLYHAAQICPGNSFLGLDGIRRLDVDTGAIDRYSYGEDFLVEEHIYVPDRTQGADDAGFLIGTALDVKRSRTVLAVFDSMNLAGGPIACATLPYGLPLGLHGSFKAV
jgi:carotenoid cleavage dioxygenase-like enzyme